MLTGLVYSAHLCSLLVVGLNQTYRLVDWFCLYHSLWQKVSHPNTMPI